MKDNEILFEGPNIFTTGNVNGIVLPKNSNILSMEEVSGVTLAVPSNIFVPQDMFGKSLSLLVYDVMNDNLFRSSGFDNDGKIIVGSTITSFDELIDLGFNINALVYYGYLNPNSNPVVGQRSINWIPNDAGYVASGQSLIINGLTNMNNITNISGIADSNSINNRGNPYTFINETSNNTTSSWIGYIHDNNDSKFFKISFTINDNNEITSNCEAKYILNTLVETPGQLSAIEAYNNNSQNASVTTTINGGGYGLKDLTLDIDQACTRISKNFIY